MKAAKETIKLLGSFCICLFLSKCTSTLLVISMKIILEFWKTFIEFVNQSIMIPDKIDVQHLFSTREFNSIYFHRLNYVINKVDINTHV